MTHARLDQIAAAIAHPSRAKILCALMTGRAYTNKELASLIALTPQSISEHLTKIESAGLTTSLRSGRHIYHQIADETVARGLEAMSLIASPPPKQARGAVALSSARCCYNHLAGNLGVQIADTFLQRGALTLRHDQFLEGPNLQPLLTALGVSDHSAGAKPCLDWTERRYHIAGPLGRAILDRFLDQNWVTRSPTARQLIVTPSGCETLKRVLGIQWFLELDS